MKRMQKVKMSLLLALATVLSLLLWPETIFAWGDSDGGRPSYTLEEINQGVLGDKIVFNSISDSVIGNEKNFVGARENTGINLGKDNVWSSDIEVEDGEEYLIRLYAHNNNPWGLDAVAENVHVSFDIPPESMRDVKVIGTIEADNAEPNEYWDDVTFHSDTAFHLEYVFGSAILENNAIGKDAPYGLSDDIVEAELGGALIGYDKIDGRIPGAYQYSCFMSIVVKVVYDTDYVVTDQMRIKGDVDETWKDDIEAKIGDEVEFRIEYTNTSDRTQKRVVIRDILPENLEYIPESFTIVNSEYPNGASTDSTALIEETGLVIGDYDAGTKGTICFSAKVNDRGLEEGVSAHLNWARVTTGKELSQGCGAIYIYKESSKYKTIVAILLAIIVVGIVAMVVLVIEICRRFLKIYKDKRTED